MCSRIAIFMSKFELSGMCDLVADLVKDAMNSSIDTECVLVAYARTLANTESEVLMSLSSNVFVWMLSQFDVFPASLIGVFEALVQTLPFVDPPVVHANLGRLFSVLRQVVGNTNPVVKYGVVMCMNVVLELEVKLGDVSEAIGFVASFLGEEREFSEEMLHETGQIQMVFSSLLSKLQQFSRDV